MATSSKSVGRSGVNYGVTVLTKREILLLGR